MKDFIVSLLYPKKCVKCRAGGSFICDNCFSEISFLEFQTCFYCQKGSIDGLTHPKCKTAHGIEGILAAIVYRGIVKKLLYQFKYPPYLSSLKKELGSLLYEGLIQQEVFMHYVTGGPVWITAVPLHPKRLRKRGYNQSELLAKELSAKTNIPYVGGILIRHTHTRPQFELKKEQRKKNMVGAFVVSKKYQTLIKGKRIIVVDDIVTTGSTIRECAKTLKSGGAGEILGVTLAHEG